MKARVLGGVLERIYPPLGFIVIQGREGRQCDLSNVLNAYMCHSYRQCNEVNCRTLSDSSSFTGF